MRFSPVDNGVVWRRGLAMASSALIMRACFGWTVVGDATVAFGS